jgi:hypothetical protein
MMKKSFFILFFFFVAAVVCFAQAFDDMPYGNPSSMTYFQQEMTSLMRFQAKYNINVPFFASATQKSASLDYQTDYINSLYSNYPQFLEQTIYDHGDSPSDSYNSKGTGDTNILLGAQIKINNVFYIPLFFNMGFGQYRRHIEEYDYIYEGVEYKTPAHLRGQIGDMFFGGGVFINTDIIKGGIYMGYLMGTDENPHISLPTPGHPDNTDAAAFMDGDSGFKIAFAPLVNTSGWKYVGEVLNNIFGYLGMGNTVLYANDGGDSKLSSLANSLNTALDFTFNRIDLGSFGLNAQTVYARGNFDAAAKTDTFGLKLNGVFSNFPFGFTLEGGYKHFYYVAKYFEEDYTDTGYFSGSIYFPFKYITLGLIYKYDSINNSMFTFALSTNFLSGFFGFNFIDKDKYDKEIYNTTEHSKFDLGARFRWNGWKAGK